MTTPHKHKGQLITRYGAPSYLPVEGYAPTALAPWRERKLALLRFIDRTGSRLMLVPRSPENPAHRACRRDYERLIRLGLAEQFRLPCGGRSNRSMIRVTDAGRALLTTPTPRVPHPYAKRKADLTLFKELNA